MAGGNRNLKSLLTWSLAQQRQEDADRPPGVTQMDPERQRWLKEALESISKALSETDLLKAALAVLKAHGDSIPTASGATEVRKLGEEELQTLESAFEQVQYFVEDLDHAKDLIPLDGVDIIIQYLHHPNHNLLQLSCDLVATATQNNPVCQQVFTAALPRLLEVVDDSSVAEGARVKALYAISCLTREYEPGLQKLLELDGLTVLFHCLHSEVKKLVIKTLFIMMSYYSPATSPQEVLMEKLTVLVSELVSILKSCHSNDELFGHVLSTVSTLVDNHLAAMEEGHRSELKVTLHDKLKTLSPSEHKPCTQSSTAAIVNVIRTASDNSSDGGLGMRPRTANLKRAEDERESIAELLKALTSYES